MAENPKNNNPSNQPLEWLLALILLVTVWPVGLFLLIRLLSKGTTRSTTTTTTRPYIPHKGPIDVEAHEVKSRPAPQRPPVGNQAPRPSAAPPQAEKSRPQPAPTQKSQETHAAPTGKPIKGGTLLSTLGALVLAGGLFALLMVGGGIVSTDFAQWRSAVPELMYCTGGICTGFVLLRFGVSRRKRARRFRKYLSLIGKRESVPIESLAKAMPVSFKRACNDLQDMLDDGILPAGYLDLSTGRLILSDAGLKDDAPKAAPKPPKDEANILRQIQAINDAISDAEMSEKIDRIQEITARILEFQKQNPDRAGELRSFLEYYLPTTLKLLRSYVQLEAQGVEGENISASKASIVGSMDKVVAGFEARLDKLFQSEALDISSDIAVLEQMLRKDGLSEDELKIELERF